MTVLRNNRESLMAVLEALLYDPLINWRLLQAEVENRRQDGMCGSVCRVAFHTKHRLFTRLRG